MAGTSRELREHAVAIWQAALAAVRADALVREAFAGPTLKLTDLVRSAARILVVGAGKAGAAMSAGLEQALADSLHKISGMVNVPAHAVGPLQAIRLQAARPPG